MLVAAWLDWGSRPLHAMASKVDSFAFMPLQLILFCRIQPQIRF